MTDLTILVDMDGVIADWMGAVADIAPRQGVERYPANSRNLGQHFGWESTNDMRQAIDAEGQKFWAQLEVLPWARALWDLCSKYGRPIICTSPSANPVCAAGKLEWLHRFFSDRFFRDFVVTPRKWLCAGPDRLLIDDHPRHIQEFIDHDGQGHLWGMPWNDRHLPDDRYGEYRLARLQEQLKELV